jgi:hypothetical protein
MADKFALRKIVSEINEGGFVLKTVGYTKGAGWLDCSPSGRDDRIRRIR